MPTYLELVRRVASDSGTGADFADTATTLVGLTGRARKFKDWTARAWERIQTMRPDWLWMRERFTGTLVVGQRSYDGVVLTADLRFGAFDTARGVREDRFSLYDPAIGQNEEAPIRWVPYEAFSRAYEIGSGSTEQGRPTRFTIMPGGILALHPIPDAAYVLRGAYVKSPQILVDDGDVPEMPAQFHDLIVYEALTLLAGTDEAPSQLPVFRNERRRLMTALVRDQMPKIGT